MIKQLLVRCRGISRGTRCQISEPNSTDPAQPDSKYHFLIHAHGTPVGTILSGTNTRAGTLRFTLVDATMAMRGMGSVAPQIH